MYCKHCGKKVNKESKFCRYCGKELPKEEVEGDVVTVDYQHPQKSSGLTSALTAVIGVLVTGLIALNFFSGIIGGLWLAFSGGLSLVLLGIFLSFVMPFGYTIAALPQMGVLGILVKLIEGGHRLIGTLLGFIASFYGNIILAIWTIYVFDNLVVSQSFNTIALLFWGYSTVMAPISYMASKEPPDSMGTSLGLLLAQICFIALSLLFVVGLNQPLKYPVLIIIAFLFSFLSASVVYSSMTAKSTA